MSDRIKNKLSDKTSSNPDTVEEAVLKYVGERLTDIDKETSKSNIDKEMCPKEGKYTFTDIPIPPPHQNGEISCSNNNNNNNNIKDINNSKTEQEVDEDNHRDQNNSNDNASDMTWYLKHDEDIAITSFNQTESPDIQQKIHNALDSINQNTLALAAVVAAYQADKLSKLKGKNDDIEDLIDTNTKADHQDNIPREDLHNNKSSRKRKINRSNEEEDMVGEDYVVKKFRVGLKRDKSRLMVDPELTTLDNPSPQHQLVNKAIAEAASISQQPDFQQYLNTEAETDVSNDLSKLNEHSTDKNHDEIKSTKNLQSIMEPDPHLSGDENLSQKDFNGLSNISSAQTINMINVTSDKNNKIEPDTEQTSQAAINEDNILLERAAERASELIGSLASTQTSGKAFDAYEEAALDQFIADYESIKKFTRKQTCERIWTNGRRKDDFWINICKVLPYRTRSSIYKHVRRRYHIFDQRGKWTPQEDQQLAKLCVDKEGQWSAIGKIMKRMPEDCRDRWRNYIKCGNNRVSNKWSLEEESMLKRVIATMLEETDTYYERKDKDSINSNREGDIQSQNSNRKPNSTKPTFKDVINWTVVSERMGGTRSRIQCRYKWNKLIRKQALSKIELITTSEKRWLVEKLRDLGFTDESQVDWDELASLQGSKWTGLELKVCYEKMRTMIKSYKFLPVNEVAKTLLETLPDDSTIVGKEQ